MSAATRNVLPSLIAAALGIAPGVSAAQVSTRPPAVDLTVVAPARPASNDIVTSDGIVSLVRSGNGADIETRVGVSHYGPARIEVRLGSTSQAAPTRVWVRDAGGSLRPLIYGSGVVAVDTPLDIDTARRVRFRVESSDSTTVGVAIPLEYRVTIGSGDQFSVWTLPSALRIDEGH